MAKRGRPTKNGAKDGWQLFRASIVIEAYHRAREAGVGYTSGVKAAMKAVREAVPTMPISPPEVNRILKDLNPSDTEDVLLVTKSENQWHIRFGPRPFYKRKTHSPYRFGFSKKFNPYK